MIFLCVPYSHWSDKVVEERVKQASIYIADKFSKGEEVFSPIVYAHNIRVQSGLPGNWEFWERFCTHTMMKCREVEVLQLEGWETSNGVKAEIALAKKFGLPIKYKTYGH